MIRNLVKSKSWLLGATVLLVALFAAGCETTFLEKSGQMPNQNTPNHVEGYQMGNSNSEAIEPVMPELKLQKNAGQATSVGDPRVPATHPAQEAGSTGVN
jgi:hypothetical protein